MTEFLPIDKDNVHLYCGFKTCFEEDLHKFMSHIYPENSDFFVPMKEKGLLRWDYIISGGRPVGAIWLIKEHPSVPVAKLGIFIAQKDMRNKGLGCRAINDYISRRGDDFPLSRVTLNVRKDNIRAINCYKKRGFKVEKEYKNEKGLKVFVMEKRI